MPPRVTRIYSWNVNGLRACAQKGFLDWLAAAKVARLRASRWVK